MNWEFLVLAVVLIPVLGSFTMPLVGLLSRPLRNAWAVLLGAATTACALALIPTAFSEAPHVFTRAVGFGLDVIFVVDGLSVFVACVSSLISTLIIIYSLGYIKEYPYQQEYFMMVVLFLGGMMGLVFSANLILMYVFWEITAICSWRLVGFFRDREIVLKADKTFLTTFGGAVFMLLGFVMVYTRTGTFNLLEMRGFPLRGWEILFITMGIFAKSATLPFHTWLPDAGVAPTPVTALLHAAVLVKIGVYAFARIFNYTFSIPTDWQFNLMLLGLISAIVSACAALMETNIKRLLAYSTISQIGYIFMGLAAFNVDRHHGRPLIHFDARPGEGRLVPRRGRDRARHRLQGHHEDGRPDEADAADRRRVPALHFLDHRHPALRRLLLQVDGHPGHPPVGQPGHRLPGGFHGDPDHDLPVAAFHAGVPRRTARSCHPRSS